MRKYLRHALIIAVLLILILFLVWLWISQPDKARLSVDAVSGKIPQITDARAQYYPTMKVARAVGWPNGGKPTAAEGLKVAAFADKLEHPRWLYRLPNGDVLVAETNSPPRDVGGITGWIMGSLMKKAGAAVPSPNRITLLRDSNGDGVADARSTLIEGLNSPFGMALVGDWLYVANTDALLRFPYKAGDTRITTKPQKVLDLPGGGNHWTRNIVASADGKSLFVSIGSSTNIAENGLEAEGPLYMGASPFQIARHPDAAMHNRASILEVSVETGKARLFAWGIRNPVGMAIEPATKSLWAVVNERDMLGSDVPPDYLTQVDLGAFFGWPWSYWGGHVDKRLDPDRPDLLQYTKRPSYALGPHVAPLGLTFAADARLGEDWTSGAFIGLHGSWNREPLSGYKVVFVPFAPNGLPAPGVKPVDVLTGFLNAKEEALGRPVGVITDATGSLLVADDVGNVIWRVSAAKPVAAPSATPAAKAQ